MSELVTVETSGPTAILTLNNPNHRNILTAPLVAAIAEAMDQLEDDAEVRAVVITGAGSAFCAGAELATLEAATRGDFELIRSVYDGFLRILRSPLLTVAAINGPAVGAGFNLALACDLRIASESATFICRFSELRILPGGGHLWLLARSVGRQRAAAGVLLGESWDAEAALRDGLVLNVVPARQLLANVTKLLQPLADLEIEYLHRLVELIRDEPTLSSHSEAVEIEAAHQEWSVGRPAFLEGLARLRTVHRP